MGRVDPGGTARRDPARRHRGGARGPADRRTPTTEDWARLSRSWRALLEARIAGLEDLRTRLVSCIGCGFLSLKTCRLLNEDDRAARRGAGARYLLGDKPPNAGSATDLCTVHRAGR